MADSDTLTERLLADAGITSGMRVIDIGCGNGEVSLLLAKVVGASGQVIGIDQNAQALRAAEQRAAELSLSHVRFVQADLSGPLPELGECDAAVGRRVLMYLADPLDVIRRLAVCVRSGGMLAFQESDATMTPGRLAPMPLHDQVNGWIWQTVAREGANIHMGFELPSILEQAGLVLQSVRADAIIQGQPLHYPLATVVRAMLPRIIHHGVASETDIGIETLDQRLAAERTGNAIFVSDMAFCIWAKKAIISR